jgi:hypothetical protein
LHVPPLHVHVAAPLQLTVHAVPAQFVMTHDVAL